MPTRSLPPHPDLGQLKLQARELQRGHAAGSRAAAARILAHHPKPAGPAASEGRASKTPAPSARAASSAPAAPWTSLRAMRSQPPSELLPGPASQTPSAAAVGAISGMT